MLIAFCLHIAVVAITEPFTHHATASVIFSARILAPLKYVCQRFAIRFPNRDFPATYLRKSLYCERRPVYAFRGVAYSA
jgi:hypothetical protein